ncbi:hypothetical protein V1522DRAFT_335885, partial [Lipomyces starkeyi]
FLTYLSMVIRVSSIIKFSCEEVVLPPQAIVALNMYNEAWMRQYMYNVSAINTYRRSVGLSPERMTY